MGRIEATFKRLKNEQRKALIPFVTAGDPSLAQTEKIVYQLEKAGADIIELGVPFSDPMADGPVIQLASERALKKGATLAGVLELVKKIRKRSEIPLLLMGYFNPIYCMGMEKFAKQASQVGVDAVLIVDLPVEEAGKFKKILNQYGIRLIFLITPTSNDERLKKIKKLASGFVYYVSMTGVTGAKLQASDELNSHLQKVHSIINLPLVIGFGISKPAQAVVYARKGEGVVVGSALIKKLFSCKGASVQVKQAHRFLSSFRQALDR